MSALNTDYFSRCIRTLEQAYTHLATLPKDDLTYDIYRAACVKEFEIILEQAGKLLKKSLRDYFATPKQADQLNFKDIFRFAAKHSLMTIEESERWMRYRDNRNATAHDYGIDFAKQTLPLLSQFILDAKQLHRVV